MGADIHFCVERQGPDGSWYRVEDLHRNPFRDEKADDPWFRRELVRESWYDGRNYTLFAVLAGVRADEDDPLITAPRGLPADACDETVEEYKSFGADAHTPSWLTTADLVAFDWLQRVDRPAWIYCAERFDGVPTEAQLRDAANEFERTGIARWPFTLTPSPILWWPQFPGTHGKNPWPVDEQIEVAWRPTVEQLVGDFLPVLIRMVRESAGQLSSVRAVFWFDN